MNLSNLKRANNSDVEKWFLKSIPEITPYQRSIIDENEIIRTSPYYFFKSKKYVSNVWLRFSLFALLIVFIILIIGLPFTFFITGKWGYDYEKIKWFHKWSDKCGI